MNTQKKQFSVCVDNNDYEASLILRKIYEILPVEQAAKDDLFRVVNESGEGMQSKKRPCRSIRYWI
jgi:hypothetical protein